MKAYRILAGMGITVTLAVGMTGAAGAHWDDDWHGPGMGPGMMGPGTGMYPNDDGWHQPGMGMDPDDGWHNPGMGMYPHHP